MKIEYTLPFRRQLDPLISPAKPLAEPTEQPPRIARLVALAHKVDGLVRSGEVRDYGELARVGHISAARLTQIMVLLHLSPVIQEHLMFLSTAEARLLPEVKLREIAREPRWDRQHEMFERLRRSLLPTPRATLNARR
jgi:hypothetical protein